MYKLIIRNWDGTQKKFESDHGLLGFILSAKFYLKFDYVKSVIVVDRTGFQYFYHSKVEGAKNISVRFSEA